MAATGSLLTYLGSAPGVGKTYAMLNEGHRRAEEEGRRVVIGWWERHGRAETMAQAGDLELVAPHLVEYRGIQLPELDVDAVVASGAQVALVDELAHSLPGDRRQRWEDVVDLLDAGLDVVTTANVASLLSVREYAALLTGVGVVESVPDDLVRAGEVRLIDPSPAVLRRRIASGRIYSAEQLGGALADYFRVVNLEALSALARAWMEGTLEAVAQELLATRGLLEEPEAVAMMVAVDGARSDDQVIRRAGQLAREADAELQVVYVDVADGAPRQPAIERDRQLADALGAGFAVVQASSLVDGVALAADRRPVGQLVVARPRSPLTRSGPLSLGARLRRRLPDLVVEEVAGPRRHPRGEGETDPEVETEPVDGHDEPGPAGTS